jgi:hypothetical protein
LSTPSRRSRRSSAADQLLYTDTMPQPSEWPCCAATSGALGRSEKSMRTTHAMVFAVRFG